MSRLIRCYAQNLPRVTGAVFQLDRDESHHLVRVLRRRRGDRVEVLDGCGGMAQAEIMTSESAGVGLRLLHYASQPAPRMAVTLAIACCKGKVMETVLRKGVELGIRVFQPLLTEYCEARPDRQRGDARLASWRALAVEAMKQSGNPHQPDVHPPMEWPDFLAAMGPGTAKELRLLAGFPPEAKPLCMPGGISRPHRAIWLIGPEGGFSPGEIEQSLQAGFVSVTLGPYVLRADTAAVSALAVLNHVLLES